MIKAKKFIDEAFKFGFNLWSGVPSSILRPFISSLSEEPQIRYVSAVNEGDAIAIASGNRLAGNRGVAIFQNSGFGNSVNPLANMNHTFNIPILMIISLKSERVGSTKTLQYGLTEKAFTKILELLGVKWDYFPSEENDVVTSLEAATSFMDKKRLPFALVMKEDSVKPYEIDKTLMSVSMPWVKARTADIPQAQVKRKEMLQTVQASCSASDVILGTTGIIGRELYGLGHRANQFYLVGSMGYVSSLALGLAVARPNIRVIALDGDGSVLMQMGSLATIGFRRPANMVHIVLDNSSQESNGSLETIAPSIDLCAIAAACGYEHIHDITRPVELQEILSKPRNAGLTFIRARILHSDPGNLPEPREKPSELAAQFSDFVQKC